MKTTLQNPYVFRKQRQQKLKELSTRIAVELKADFIYFQTLDLLIIWF